MTVFAIRWPSRAARRPADRPLPASVSVATPAVVQVPEITVAYDLPPVVQPGPNGCTKRVTCRGRAGKDGRCAAHKAA